MVISDCFGPPPPDPRMVILGFLLLWMAREELVETLVLLFVLVERTIDALLRALARRALMS